MLKDFVTAQAPRYGAVAAPTVIISGHHDAAVHLETHARTTVRFIPDAKLIVLEGIGHMPHHVAAGSIIAAIDGVSNSVIASEAKPSPPRVAP